MVFWSVPSPGDQGQALMISSQLLILRKSSCLRMELVTSLYLAESQLYMPVKTQPFSEAEH